MAAALNYAKVISTSNNNNSNSNSATTPTATYHSSASAGGGGEIAISATAPPTNVQEYKIRVPKNLRKKHHVMRFNATLNVDFAQWRSVKLERENNMKEFKGLDEDMPKFGAGSEYNRDLREEVRRKKFGIIAKKYRPEAQPWILKVGGKNSKKFKGIREGGVGENAAFYVFTHAPDGAIEAYPLNEWYNFQPIQRYKALSAEEAEEEFGRRKRNMNFFTLMLRKRLKPDEEEELDPDEIKAKGNTKKSKELKISEMDEWIDTDDDSDSNSDDDGDDGDNNNKNKNKENSDDDGASSKKKNNNKHDGNKKKKRDVNDEAFEESDDGDEEGREMDYDTESSLDEPDPEAKLDKDMKSVAEEDALRKLLTSDEDEEPENKSEESENEDDEAKRKNNKNKTNKDGDVNNKDKKKNSSSDFSSDSSNSDDDDNTTTKIKNSSSREPSTSKILSSNQSSSRSTTPTFSYNDASNVNNTNTNTNSNNNNNNNSNYNKRKLNSMPGDLTGSENSNSPISTPAKRNRMETSSNHVMPSTFTGVVNTITSSSSGGGLSGSSSNSNKDDFGITEEAVRRYLMRKPMTATELLTKFKNKKTGVSSERLVETMTQILKKINPVKQTIQGKMYLSIKVNK